MYKETLLVAMYINIYLDTSICKYKTMFYIYIYMYITMYQYMPRSTKGPVYTNMPIHEDINVRGKGSVSNNK